MKTRIVIDGNAFYEIDEECTMEKERKGKMPQQDAGNEKKNGKNVRRSGKKK